MQIVTQVGKFPYREDGGSLVKRSWDCVFGCPAGISCIFKTMKVRVRQDIYRCVQVGPVQPVKPGHTKAPPGISCIFKTMKVRVQQRIYLPSLVLQDIYHRIPAILVLPV